MWITAQRDLLKKKIFKIKMGQNTLTAQQTATNFFLFIAVSKKKKNTDMEKVKLIDFF